MIAFVIPIKPRRFSKDWEKENRLLDRTIGSLLNQKDDQYRIYVIYTDRPEIKFDSQSIVYIPFDFKFADISEIEDYVQDVQRYIPNQDYAAKMFDKGRKIMLGCKAAKSDGCKYIMGLDSDDLVSGKLSSFVNMNQKNRPGWVIRRGYIYLEKRNVLLRRKQLNYINGSTHIVNVSLVPDPDMKSMKFMDFNFFESHGYLEKRIHELYHVKLDTLPFRGVIYTVNSNNASNINVIFRLANWKTVLKVIIRGRLVSKRIRREFNLIPV